MLRKEVERQFNQTFKFKKPGDMIHGVVVGVRHDIETRYKKASFVDIMVKCGETTSVVITAGLRGVGWDNFIGKTVEIVYEGYTQVDDDSRPYKSYKIYELSNEGDEEPEITDDQRQSNTRREPAPKAAPKKKA